MNKPGKSIVGEYLSLTAASVDEGQQGVPFISHIPQQRPRSQQIGSIWAKKLTFEASFG
jgi:hypothetical protein